MCLPWPKGGPQAQAAHIHHHCNAAGGESEVSVRGRAGRAERNTEQSCRGTGRSTAQPKVRERREKPEIPPRTVPPRGPSPRTTPLPSRHGTPPRPRAPRPGAAPRPRPARRCPLRSPRPLTMNFRAFSCSTASAGSIAVRGAAVAPPRSARPHRAPTGTCAAPRAPPPPHPRRRQSACAARGPTGNGVSRRAAGEGPRVRENYKSQRAVRQRVCREPGGARAVSGRESCWEL